MRGESIVASEQLTADQHPDAMSGTAFCNVL